MLLLSETSQLVARAAVSNLSQILAFISYEILENPDTEQKLRNELKPFFTDPDKIPKAKELEKLPFLTGCVKEGLRYVNILAIYHLTLVLTPYVELQVEALADSPAYLPMKTCSSKNGPFQKV
jgi:cytochrome P450